MASAVSTWNSATLPKSKSLKYFKFFTTNLCTKQYKLYFFFAMVQQQFMLTNWKVYCPFQTSIFYVQREAAFLLIYVIFGHSGQCMDTKLQIGASFNKNMNLRSAVHRAFFLGIFQKITTFMATSILMDI
jgi:hypothetical protein